MVKEHLLPVGELDVQSDVELQQCEVLGMEEVLVYAPAEGSVESVNMFVQGVMPNGHTLIKLDLTWDHYPLRLVEHLSSLDGVIL